MMVSSVVESFFFVKMLQQTIAESVKLFIFNLVNFFPRSETLMCPVVSAILSSCTLFLFSLVIFNTGLFSRQS